MGRRKTQSLFVVSQHHISDLIGPYTHAPPVHCGPVVGCEQRFNHGVTSRLAINSAPILYRSGFSPCLPPLGPRNEGTTCTWIGNVQSLPNCVGFPWNNSLLEYSSHIEN